MTDSSLEPIVAEPIGILNLDALTGFRLQRFEVYNWGTFHGQVWSLNLDGQNALLTGDVGSGKSTLVDAVTTLLVPAHHIAYNKAAGAARKERDLKSYVLGYYKSEKHESAKSKPVPLRDGNTYSVILGVFHNSGFNQTITLAQVFWIKDGSGQPARMYVGAERALSIPNEFSNFGTDISSLRKKLKASGAELFDSFPAYSAWFRRRFGIENEQALELFHQTVSMKSVGDLTEFVRTHMLEPFDVAPRITALLNHFDDLNSAHEALLKAARQIELLTPLVANCNQRLAVAEEIEGLRACREALKLYFATLKLDLLKERVSNLEEEWSRRDDEVKELERQELNQRNEESKIKQSIADNGGDRIEHLAQEIGQLQLELQDRKEKERRYKDYLQVLDMQPAPDADSFVEQTQVLGRCVDEVRDQDASLQNSLTEASVELRDKNTELNQVLTEITSLKSRRSNIPKNQVDMRAALCNALNLPEAELPYAGELLQVRDDQKDWEGAAERVLRNFGLSLLVPDKHYNDVHKWIETTSLYGLKVYFKVPSKVSGNLPSLDRDSLARKIAIKSDTPFYDWLEREVAHRADFVCCATADDFRRVSKAVTAHGQIKWPGDRHEKDDRHRIDDRSRFVLGWSNAAKITALEHKSSTLTSELTKIQKTIDSINLQRTTVTSRLEALAKLSQFTSYKDIDWRSLSIHIAQLEEEKKELESASDVLAQLTEQLRVLANKLKITKTALDDKKDKRSKTEERIETAENSQKELIEMLNGAPHSMHVTHYDVLEKMRIDLLGEHLLTVESCHSREQDMRSSIQKRIDSEDSKLKRLTERIIEAMTQYKQLYPQDTQEVDVSVDAGFEYAQMLESLRRDDLPRFQERFKILLNENTIREVANFQSQLSREREEIRERITKINQSLTQIDYNPGRYIVLEGELSQDADIRDFQMDLRACTEGTLTGSDDEQYSEDKFLQVKQIIERFRGREGQAEHDNRWTDRVTDVRNWFDFSASERWREDDREHEHYSDSGGKSGGQKEKLAYTILAASLAYRFGLDWSGTRSRSFRFVVIDEAFGKGSDESARFGLELFEQLKLQILVITPLQKIHIIEPFVRSVGFVHNNDRGNASKIRNLSIEEYQAEKAKSAHEMDHA